MNYINTDKEIFANLAVSASTTEALVQPNSGIVAWFSYAVPTGLTATIQGTPDDPSSLTARWVSIVTSKVGDDLTYKVSSVSYRGLKVVRNSGAGSVVIITASRALGAENPLDNKTGLIGYFEADTGITLDGLNKVSQWDDLSGNGYNLTQATSGNRPGYSTTVFGGKPGVVLNNAAGSFMTASPVFAGGGTAHTLLAVVRANAAAAAVYNGVVTLGSGNAGGQTSTVGSDSSGYLWFGGSGYGLPVFNAVTNGAYYILAKTTKNVSGPLGYDTPFINGVKKTPYTQSAAYIVSPTNTLMVGRYTSSGNPGNWDIARIAVWNRELSDAEIYAQMAGASEKFSISI